MTDDQTRAEILDEHRRIRAIVSRLDGMGVGDATRRLELGRELFELLTVHFAREEEASLVADHPARFARFAKALERLAEDHGEILSELRRWLDDPLDPTADDSLRRTLKRLERHEAAETEILQRAYSDDLGGGG